MSRVTVMIRPMDRDELRTAHPELDNEDLVRHLAIAVDWWSKHSNGSLRPGSPGWATMAKGSYTVHSNGIRMTDVVPIGVKINIGYISSGGREELLVRS